MPESRIAHGSRDADTRRFVRRLDCKRDRPTFRALRPKQGSARAKAWVAARDPAAFRRSRRTHAAGRYRCDSDAPRGPRSRSMAEPAAAAVTSRNFVVRRAFFLRERIRAEHRARPPLLVERCGRTALLRQPVRHFLRHRRLHGLAGILAGPALRWPRDGAPGLGVVGEPCTPA